MRRRHVLRPAFGLGWPVRHACQSGAAADDGLESEEAAMSHAAMHWSSMTSSGRPCAVSSTDAARAMVRSVGSAAAALGPRAVWRAAAAEATAGGRRSSAVQCTRPGSVQLNNCSNAQLQVQPRLLYKGVRHHARCRPLAAERPPPRSSDPVPAPPCSPPPPARRSTRKRAPWRPSARAAWAATSSG